MLSKAKSACGFLSHQKKKSFHFLYLDLALILRETGKYSYLLYAHKILITHQLHTESSHEHHKLGCYYIQHAIIPAVT